MTGGDEVASSAVISTCGTYRYELRRTWNSLQPTVGWIMLNPSSADATRDDATIRRCVAFARAWGYGGITVRNLFALRATDPRELRRHPDPVGPNNDWHLLHGAHVEDAVTVCAWGAHGAYLGRADAVLKRMARHGLTLHHLGLTKAGQPRHPLYLPGSVTPTEYLR
jgi:hypothetical protein